MDNLISDNFSHLNFRKNYINEVTSRVDGKFKTLVYKILGNKNKYITSEDVIFSDAEYEKYLREINSQSLELVSNTSLYLNNFSRHISGTPLGRSFTLSGILFGKNIFIEYYESFGKYFGKIDGKIISNNYAEEIFKKFENIALERTKRLNVLKMEKSRN